MTTWFHLIFSYFKYDNNPNRLFIVSSDFIPKIQSLHMHRFTQDSMMSPTEHQVLELHQMHKVHLTGLHKNPVSWHSQLKTGVQNSPYKWEHDTTQPVWSTHSQNSFGKQIFKKRNMHDWPKPLRKSPLNKVRVNSQMGSTFLKDSPATFMWTSDLLGIVTQIMHVSSRKIHGPSKFLQILW